MAMAICFPPIPFLKVASMSENKTGMDGNSSYITAVTLSDEPKEVVKKIHFHENFTIATTKEVRNRLHVNDISSHCHFELRFDYSVRYRVIEAHFEMTMRINII